LKLATKKKEKKEVATHFELKCWIKMLSRCTTSHWSFCLGSLFLIHIISSLA